MMNIQISGNLPSLNADLTSAMARIAERMYNDAIGGFDSSGYGQWPIRRDGSPATLGGPSGTIAGTMQKSYGPDFAEVSIMNTIHQRGGSMIITDKMRSFFWAKWYQTKDEKYKWMALTRSGILSFPIRTYLSLQESFFEFAEKELLGHIFRVSETVTDSKSS